MPTNSLTPGVRVVLLQPHHQPANDTVSHLLNHCRRRWRDRHSLLLYDFLLAPFVSCLLPCGDLVESAALCFRPDMGVARSMARETCPAMSIITSSPAPDSASSVTSVWRLSCHRLLVPAFWRQSKRRTTQESVARGP